MERRRALRTEEAVATTIEVHDLAGRTRIPNAAGIYSFTTASGLEVRHEFKGHSFVGEKWKILYDPHDPDNHANADASIYTWSYVLWDNSWDFFLGLYFLFLAWGIGRKMT
jgi:hypothetical protein